jgi:hypothetical protein
MASRDSKARRELGEKLAKQIDFSKPSRRVERDRDDGLPKALLARMQKQGFEPSTTDVSGNIVNPYGSTGLRQYISFPNLEQKQINEIYNKRVQRFLAPETMAAKNPQAMRRGFGSLFGSSEGEATISGPLRKQLPEGGMSTPDMIARGVASLMTPFGPILSMTDPRGTNVVPEGSPAYDPSTDPRNKDTSMLGNMLNFFTGGAGTEAGSQIRDLLPDISSLLPGGSQQPVTTMTDEDLSDAMLTRPLEPSPRDLMNAGNEFGGITSVVEEGNISPLLQQIRELLKNKPFEYTPENQQARTTPSELFLY